MEKYNSPHFVNCGSNCGRIFMFVLQADWPEIPQTPFFSGVQKAPKVQFYSKKYAARTEMQTKSKC